MGDGAIGALLGAQEGVDTASTKRVEGLTGAWSSMINGLKTEGAMKDLARLMQETPAEKEIKGGDIMDIAVKYNLDKNQMSDLFMQFQSTGMYGDLTRKRSAERFEQKQKELVPQAAKAVTAAIDDKGYVHLDKVPPELTAAFPLEWIGNIQEHNRLVSQGKYITASPGSVIFNAITGKVEVQVPNVQKYEQVERAKTKDELAAITKVGNLLRLPTKVKAGMRLDAALAADLGLQEGYILTPQDVEAISGQSNAEVDAIVTRYPGIAQDVVNMRAGMTKPGAGGGGVQPYGRWDKAGNTLIKFGEEKKPKR